MCRIDTRSVSEAIISKKVEPCSKKMQHLQLADFFFAIFLLGLNFLSSTSYAWELHLCNRFLLRGKLQTVEFTSNERTLICGNKDLNAWSNTADTQALFHIKTFLQDRAYYDSVSETVGNQIIITLGEQKKVSSWQLIGSPKEIDSIHFRRIGGEALTPQLLDSVTSRVRNLLEISGYSCPSVKTEASAVNGKVWTTLLPPRKRSFFSVVEEPVPGLNTSVLRRYDAFTIGDPFNIDLLTLTENRITAENILQSTHFNVTCSESGVHLLQKNVAGPPHLFTFGFGLNTEKLVSAKVSWKNLRMGEQGSKIELNLLGSFRSQEFNSTLDWYFSNSFERFHFRPAFFIKHESEYNFERYTGELQLTPATSWDGRYLGLRAYFGPSIQAEKLVVGIGPSNSQFLAFITQLSISEHSFELYRSSPRGGFEVNLLNQSTFNHFLSPVDAQKTTLRLTQLWNLGNWEPPFVILGFRGAAAFTITPEALGGKSKLPSDFRLFLGGASDLRGFDRLELPGPEGALSSVFSSLELRFPDLIPWSLQPVCFVDAGMLGIKTFDLDSNVYWSPGGGMRWESPIGAFRGTLARGLVSGDEHGHPARWRIYFSYGEEF